MRSVVSLLIILVCTGAYAQNTDSLFAEAMTRGGAYFESEKFDLALIEYDRAFQLQPKNATVNYEIAITYYAIGNLDKALKYAKTASKDDSEMGLESTILLGGILDEQGHSRKSVKTFEQGIKQFGGFYLLYYHLGIAATDDHDIPKAIAAYQSALASKFDHSESHFALARLMLSEGRNSESVFPLMFFLLLNPDHEAAPAACNSLRKVLSEGERQLDGKNRKHFNNEQGYTFQVAELLLSAYALARPLEQYSGKTELEVDAEVLVKLVEFLGDADFEDRNDFYTSYYIPFFNNIVSNGFTMELMHFIYQSKDDESKAWLTSHQDRVEDFFSLLDENRLQ